MAERSGWHLQALNRFYVDLSKIKYNSRDKKTSGVAKENKLNTEKYMVKASAALITAKNIEFDRAVVQEEPDTSLCEGDRLGGSVTFELISWRFFLSLYNGHNKKIPELLVEAGVAEEATWRQLSIIKRLKIKIW